jgi:NAD(P)-dependent dehydrogenase (short-subunit alcohol dehydrogenase family)
LTSARRRVAVITGAASGIGAATARRLAEDGYRVWLGDLDMRGAEAGAALLRAAGASASAVALDVADESSVRRAFEVITSEDSAIDVLVNAAGIALVGALEVLTVDMWERTFRVNVIGTYLCIQLALPALRAATPPARVINIASTAARTAGPFTAPYHASKAAVVSLTRSAGAALAPQILVNCVCPGLVDTPMLDELTRGTAKLLADQTSSTSSDLEALRRRQSASTAIGRSAVADEVAGSIAFLAGPDATYFVGAAIEVNGGLALS